MHTTNSDARGMVSGPRQIKNENKTEGSPNGPKSQILSGLSYTEDSIAPTSSCANKEGANQHGVSLINDTPMHKEAVGAFSELMTNPKPSYSSVVSNGSFHTNIPSGTSAHLKMAGMGSPQKKSGRTTRPLQKTNQHEAGAKTQSKFSGVSPVSGGQGGGWKQQKSAPRGNVGKTKPQKSVVSPEAAPVTSSCPPTDKSKTKKSGNKNKTHGNSSADNALKEQIVEEISKLQGDSDAYKMVVDELKEVIDEKERTIDQLEEATVISVLEKQAIISHIKDKKKVIGPTGKLLNEDLTATEVFNGGDLFIAPVHTPKLGLLFSDLFLRIGRGLVSVLADNNAKIIAAFEPLRDDVSVVVEAVKEHNKLCLDSIVSFVDKAEDLRHKHVSAMAERMDTVLQEDAASVYESEWEHVQDLSSAALMVTGYSFHCYQQELGELFNYHCEAFGFFHANHVGNYVDRDLLAAAYRSIPRRTKVLIGTIGTAASNLLLLPHRMGLSETISRGFFDANVTLKARILDTKRDFKDTRALSNQGYSGMQETLVYTIEYYLAVEEVSTLWNPRDRKSVV